MIALVPDTVTLSVKPYAVGLAGVLLKEYVIFAPTVCENTFPVARLTVEPVIVPTVS